YITVLTAKDLLAQAERQLNLSQKQLQQAKILHEEGNIDPGDFHDLKGAFSETKNELATARQNLFHSRIKLAGLLHLPEEGLPELKALPPLQKERSAPPVEVFESGKNRPFYTLWDWRI